MREILINVRNKIIEDLSFNNDFDVLIHTDDSSNISKMYFIQIIERKTGYSTSTFFYEFELSVIDIINRIINDIKANKKLSYFLDNYFITKRKNEFNLKITEKEEKKKVRKI